MKVAVIGTGYVGLVAGTCLADTGNDVTCVDVDAEKIAKLTRGEIPIYEPGLSELVKKNVGGKRLAFTTDLAAAVKPAQVVFIAVGTPSSHDGAADLSAVLGVSAAIAAHVASYKVIVLKSTVPVGTNAKVAAAIGKATSAPFDVASNPEFMKEGAALDDFLKPDRVIIGTTSEKAKAVLQELYEPFVRSGKPIIYMDPASAEMTKYAANAMLATKISFMNEIAALCEATGADVEWVRKGIGSDARIGTHFIYPGLGFGGSCFPKDVRAIARIGKDFGVPMKLADAVETINLATRERIAKRVLALVEPAKGKRIAVWGLAFKPKTDDVRESPAITLCERFAEAGARVVAFDPEARETAGKVLGAKIEYAPGLYEATEGAEALVLATEWNEFRHPDFERIRSLMKRPLLFDARNIFDPARMAALGFEYHAVGRPSTR